MKVKYCFQTLVVGGILLVFLGRGSCRVVYAWLSIRPVSVHPSSHPLFITLAYDDMNMGRICFLIQIFVN